MSIAAIVPSIVRRRRAEEAEYETLRERNAASRGPTSPDRQKSRRLAFLDKVDQPLRKLKAQGLMRLMTVSAANPVDIAKHLDVTITPEEADRGYAMSLDIEPGGYFIRFAANLDERQKKMMTALAAQIPLQPYTSYEDFGTLNFNLSPKTGFQHNFVSVEGKKCVAKCIDGRTLRRAAGLVAPLNMIDMVIKRAPDIETAATWLSEDCGLYKKLARQLIKERQEGIKERAK